MPHATTFWRTVVSGGTMYGASGMSSKPTTERSSGTRMPRSVAAVIPAIAMRSLP